MTCVSVEVTPVTSIHIPLVRTSPLVPLGCNGSWPCRLWLGNTLPMTLHCGGEERLFAGQLAASLTFPLCLTTLSPAALSIALHHLPSPPAQPCLVQWACPVLIRPLLGFSSLQDSPSCHHTLGIIKVFFFLPFL